MGSESAQHATRQVSCSQHDGCWQLHCPLSVAIGGFHGSNYRRCSHWAIRPSEQYSQHLPDLFNENATATYGLLGSTQALAPCELSQQWCSEQWIECDGASLCLVCEMFRGVKGGSKERSVNCCLVSAQMRGLLASCCMVLQAALFD